MKLIWILLSCLSIAQEQQDLNPEFYRTWVRYEFYTDIESGKTPRQSMRMEPLMQLYFFEEGNQILFGSFNEGITAQYIIKSYDTIEVCCSHTYGNGFVASIIRENNEVNMMVDDGKKKMIFKGLDKKYYDRDGVDFFVNDKFVVGEYISAADSSVKVAFYLNGNVTGIKNFNKYVIPLLGLGLPDDFDTMILQERQVKIKDHEVFHWVKTGDSLFLYNLKPSSDDEMDGFRYYKAKILDKYLELIKID